MQALYPLLYAMRIKLPLVKKAVFFNADKDVYKRAFLSQKGIFVISLKSVNRLFSMFYVLYHLMFTFSFSHKVIFLRRQTMAYYIL